MKNKSNTLKDLEIDLTPLCKALQTYTRSILGSPDRKTFGSLLFILGRNFNSSRSAYHLIFDMNTQEFKINWFHKGVSDNDLSYKYFIDKKNNLHLNDITFDRALTFMMKQESIGANYDQTVDSIKDALLERIGKLIIEERLNVNQHKNTSVELF